MVRTAEASRFGLTPVDQNFTAFPDGESLVGLSAISQAIPIAFAWIGGKLFDPYFLTNFYIWLGWVVSGLCVYFLARAIVLRVSVSVAAGCLAQFLPSMQLASSTAPNLIWYGLATMPLALLLRQGSMWNTRHVGLASLITLTLSLWDPYIYAFSLVAFYTTVLAEWRTLSGYLSETPWKRRFLIILPSMPAGLLFAFWLNSVQDGRKVVAVDAATLDATGVRLWELVLPGFEHPLGDITAGIWANWDAGGGIYFGLIAGSIVLLAVVTSFRQFARRTRLLFLNIGVLGLLAMRNELEIPGILLENPVHYLRELLPGILYFARAQIVFQLMLAVALLASVTVLIRNHSRVKRVWTTSLVLLVVALDIGSSSYRGGPVGEVGWQALRDEISGMQSTTGVVFMPNDFYGTPWLQQVYLEVPMYNSIRDPNRISTIKWVSRPPKAACQLQELGISDILINAAAPELPPVFDTLTAPSFILEGEYVVKNFQGRDVLMRHFTPHCQISRVDAVG